MIDERIFSLEFLKHCQRITERYDKACGKWSLADQLNHIHDEVSEVSDVLRNKKEKYGKTGSIEYNDKLLDEIADVFLTTISLTNILDLAPDKINEAVQKKIKIVEQRAMELSTISPPTKERKGQHD